MDDFESVWAAAVATYEKETSHNLSKDSIFRKFQSLEDLQKATENDHVTFSAFREEHRRVFKPLSKAIAPILPLINIVQKGINNSPYAPVGAVLGACSLLLQACQNVSKSYDGIEALFEQIAAITVRLNEYEFKTIDASLRNKIVEILAYILEIFGKAETLIKRKRVKQWLRSAFTQDDDIKDSVAKLQVHVEQELGLVIALTYGQVKEIHNVADDVRSQVSAVRAGVGELLSNQRNDRQRAFSEADEKLLADSMKTRTLDEVYRQHTRNVEALTKGTGLWLKDDEMWQAWEDEQAPILWVFGKPGFGKTMLAARTVETLLHKYSQHDVTSLTSVSYLYFKDDKPELQSCDDMWKTAILQATKSNAKFKKFVITTIKARPEVLSSARRIWQDLFLNFFTEDARSSNLTSLAFVVIDGLDEAPESERVKLLYCLGELVRQITQDRKCRVQVAIFCRPDVRADPGFERVGFRRRERIIEVTPERNNTDIEAFIKQRLAEVVVLKELKKRKATKDFQNLAKQIFNDVLSRSQGMFLWASLMFDQIRSSPSPESVRSALQQAPTGLDDMLHHVFLRLNAEEQFHQSYLSHLLAWTFCTHRPLTIAELFVLILITSSQHCVMLEKDLRSRYSSLFLVDDPGIDEESVEEDVPDDAEAETKSDDGSEEDSFDFLTSNDEDGDDVETLSTSNDSSNEGDQDSTADAEGDADDQHSDETSFRLSSNWYDNKAVFSHARIRDYLRTEGNSKTRRWSDCAIVPEDLNSFQLTAAMACLKVLKSNIAYDYEVDSLMQYAKLNWMTHLLEADFAVIPGPSQIQIAQNLATFFSSGSAVHASAVDSWYHFHETWFDTDKYSKVVRSIIGDHIEAIDPEIRPWAVRAKGSVKELFAPFIDECAKFWLTKTGWDDTGYLDKGERQAWTLYVYSKLDDDGPSENFEGRQYWVSFGQVPINELEALADRPNIEKTAHWHAGLAWILMEVNEPVYTQHAIDHFNQALEISPNGWMALEGLAKCYGDNEHNYAKAVTTMEEAVRCLPDSESFEGIDHYLLVGIAGWKLQLDDAEALEIGRLAFEGGRAFTWGTGMANDTSMLRSIKFYLEALFKAEEYDQFMAVIHELRQTPTHKKKDNLFSIFLLNQDNEEYNADVFTKVSAIGRLRNDTSYAQTMAEAVQEVCSFTSDNINEEDRVDLALRGSDFIDRYAKDSSFQRNLLSKVVQLIDDSDEAIQQNLSWERTEAADRLSRVVLAAAVAAHDVGQDHSKEVAQLQELAMHKQGSKRFYRASYSALAFGLWLREYAKADEDTWKACMRPSVTQGLYLLSDDDPWNDQQAYIQLGTALSFAGDPENAAIALGIVMKPLEQIQLSKRDPQGDEADANDFVHVTSAEGLDTAAAEGDEGEEKEEEQVLQESTTEDTQTEALANEESNQESATPPNEDADINFRYAGFELRFECDGPCTTAQDAYAELHACVFCDDIAFCEECIKLLKTETLPYRCCSKTHQHLKMFPLTNEATRITNDLIERRYEAQQEWLAGLKAAWILDKSS